MNIEQYKCLWDGSEEGWVLHHTDHVVWSITYLFSPEGPSKDEIVALRKVVPEFKNKSLSFVVKKLKGVQDYTDESPYGNIEAKILESEIGSLGLKCTMNAEQMGGYLPVSKNNMAVLIEDEKICIAVCEKMLEAGVPVKYHTHVD
jgi:hypothetical protein